MENIVGQKIIKNHQVCDVKDLNPRNAFIYEVIRVKKSHPIFCDEHYYRLLSSNHNKSFGCSLEKFREGISMLVSENKIYDCNVKIVYDNNDFYMFFIKSFYPDEKYHSYGADVVTANIIRNTPNIKKYNHAYRTKADRIMNDNCVYEVLLVNNEGYITEGSKSNVFFLKSKVIYTASDNLVLKGITRTKVIESIREMEIPIVFQAVKEAEVADYDCAFLTGTSIDVFKIRKINDVILDDNEIIGQISQKFLSKIK